MISFPGTCQQYALVNALSQETEQFQLQAKFDPPSKSMVEQMAAFARIYEDGKGPSLQTIAFSEIEGNDLSKAWEPVWDEHPATKSTRPNKGSG